MNRIVFLPVDERFCTRNYFILACEALNIEIVTPPVGLLGSKKISPDMNLLHRWLVSNVRPGDYLIISVDMLVYGGLIPSRISNEKYETLETRLNLIKEFKERNTRIYVNSAITRLPFYNSSEEEPDYWEYFGEKIYALSKEYVKNNSGEPLREYINAESTILHKWIIDDLCERRERNFRVISRTIDLLNDGYIDFYNLVLDDNSENSISIFEANKHRENIVSKNLEEKVSIHPGADESSLTLLSRALSDNFKIRPKFKVFYMNPEQKTFIPPYEGSPFNESLKDHIYASGGEIVAAGEDISLIANNPVNNFDSSMQILGRKNNFSEMDKMNFNDTIIGFSDPKYVNGADNSFVKKILALDINWLYSNFSGWNTSGNTVGTSCALSILQFYGKNKNLTVNEEKMREMMTILLLEHWGFQANVRQELLSEARKKGVIPWTIIPEEKWAEKFVEEKLRKYFDEIKKSTEVKKSKIKVYFPWHRSFELGIDIE